MTDRNLPGAAIVAAAAILLPSPAAAADDALVVRATGPSAASYPAGRKLPGSARIRLQAGDAIVLVDARGTRMLRGPGSFSASASAAPAAAAAPSMAALAQNSNRRVRIGAVRGVPGTASARPNLWIVDVAKPGPVCVLDPATIVLWRPDPTAATTLTLAVASGPASAPVAFAAGQSSAAWPTAVAPADGATYRLTNGTQAPVTIRLRVIAAPADGVPGAASALIAAGCTAQLDQMVDASLAEPAK